MKKKIKKVIYNGLGFPIKLVNVSMVKVLGDWAMDIDWTELQLVVLKNLTSKPTRLAKQELKFIRQFFELTTTEFGKLFGVGHTAVVQWESGKRNVSPCIELCIRLYAMDKLQVGDKEFRNFYNQFDIEQIAKKSVKSAPIIEVDAKDLKLAL